MSWEAVTWANKQRLKKSYEQIVLLVLANCADPNGEAFVKWPGRDHWWVYLSERTRLPKSSLFRHLNTLVALGLGERTSQVLSDGSKRPTFKLNMEAAFDIEQPEDREKYDAVFSKGSPENQSPVETEHGDDVEADENDNDISHSQGAETAEASQSPVETETSTSQSPMGTKPVPVLGLHKDSKSFPKDSPLPPFGGLSASAPLWEEFRKAWGEPIPKLALARQVFDHIETAKCGEAVAAAKGYFVWLRQHPKPPATVSAQAFLRDQAGWAQWLRYVPSAPGIAPSLDVFGADTVEARAVLILHDIAHLSDFARRLYRRPDGSVSYRGRVDDRVRALAQSPKPEDWVTLNRQQAAAWDGLLRDHVLANRTIRMAEGSRAPWPWPPSVEGKIYTSAHGPPDGEPSEHEAADFK